MLGWYLAADQPTHQNRDQRNREQGRTCHRVCLGEGERGKQPPLLTLQRKDRDERKRDDEQAEKQRRAHFGGSVRDYFPTLLPLELGTRMIVRTAFEVLVGVFDHDDGGINHRADGDSDPP